MPIQSIESKRKDISIAKGIGIILMVIGHIYCIFL